VIRRRAFDRAFALAMVVAGMVAATSASRVLAWELAAMPSALAWCAGVWVAGRGAAWLWLLMPDTGAAK